MPHSQIQPGVSLKRLEPGLGRTCSDYIRSYRAGLCQAVYEGESGRHIAHRHAQILDGLLGALFCASDAVGRTQGRHPKGRVALVAVGGYGRGTLGLASDVDVLFLCDDPTDPFVEALAQGVLYPMWDLGVDIAHTVRGVDETIELARQDLRTATTLLDLRRVAGDRRVVSELLELGRRSVLEPGLSGFLEALERDTADRHERFGGSLFLLEPEVKQGRGGLRDLDVAEWAAQARWNARGREALIRSGALLAREADELDEAHEMLWRVRNLLHARASRGQDRLTFQDQEEIALHLGYKDSVTLAVEQFMQAYYRNARIVAQTAERMLARAHPDKRRQRTPSKPLGDGTLLFGQAITLENSQDLETDPALAFRLYRQVVRHNLPPYSYARDAIARLAVDPQWQQRLRSNPEAQHLFLTLLTHIPQAPVRQGSILGELHEVGLMLAMVPEFEAVTGRVQHDVYHIYTVDVHSVAAIDRLRALIRGDFANDLPTVSHLAGETPRPIPLFLGLLLHDIGKAHGKDHARKGAAMARPIAERLGLPEVDVEHVVWLVEQHLSLYLWATRRDIGDPETVQEMARIVVSLERLRDLYLLTVADLSTTNPKAMTSWKARMLEDLYLSVGSALGGRSPTSRASAIREAILSKMRGDPNRRQLETFVEAMPDRYFLAHPEGTVQSHARMALRRGRATALVALAEPRSEDASELLVMTDDRPGLLADVAAVLESRRIEVISAHIYTRPREGLSDEAVDVFYVRSTRPLTGKDAERIEHDLVELLENDSKRGELTERISRPAPTWARRKVPAVHTAVTIDNKISPHSTVIDVYTMDRLGLLHTIARTLHDQKLTITLSKINTEGAKVADVFYVHETNDGKISDPERLRSLQQLLKESIEQFHERAELHAQ